MLLVSYFIKRLRINLEAYLYTAATITYVYCNYTETYFFRSSVQKRPQYISLLFSISSSVLWLILFVLWFFTSYFINYVLILGGIVDTVFVLNSLHCFISLPVTFNNSFKSLWLVPLLLGMVDVTLFHSCPLYLSTFKL